MYPSEPTKLQSRTRLRQPGLLRQYETAPPDETSRQFGTLRRRETRTLSLPPHLTRKSPQPYPDRRNPIPGLRSL